MDDHLPFAELIASPLKTLRRACTIVITALILGLFAPGVAYYALGTFSRDDVVAKLNLEKQAEVRKQDKLKSDTEITLRQLDERVAGASTISADELTKLLDARSKLNKYITEYAPSIHISPFYPDALIIVWALFYTAFCILIFLMPPVIRERIANKDRFELFFILFIIYRWPTWI